MSRIREKLTNELTLAVALHRNSDALTRLRRALCGLDREDRIEVAERLTAISDPNRRRRSRSAGNEA